MIYPSTITFLSLLTSLLVSALPQETGYPTSAPAEASGYPPPTATSEDEPATTISSTTYTGPPPTDTPKIFIDVERGIVIDSVDPNGGGVDGRWSGRGRYFRAFQFDDTFTAEMFQARFYDVPEDWDRATGPDHRGYYTWTSGVATRTATVSVTPFLGVENQNGEGW
uniref:Uncharacterized protein n=1 Tax=Kwoniella bestiolae CBS 10118 TaxID=1296100 RepID=A0A1B9FYL9_9TREE|nr:hypothetical protein I302_06834 [Kwoniella bestiolae CBS 10118]OCF23850.1 hypothetical protein I302_06834 [Kwoniella bestiolae CBS 10118]